MKISKRTYRLEIDENSGGIINLSLSNNPAFNLANDNGRLGMLAITSNRITPRYEDVTLDLSGGPKECVRVLDFSPECVLQLADDNSASFCNHEYNAQVTYTFEDDGFCIRAEADDKDIVQFGINVSLKYLGTRGYPFEHQAIPSSPYTSEDHRVNYFLMPRPDKNFVVITCGDVIDGWKLDYSEYNFGHFILNMKMLEAFDGCYKEPRGNSRHALSIWFDFANDLSDAMEIVSRRLSCPVPIMAISGGLPGTRVRIPFLGKCIKAEVETPDKTYVDISETLKDRYIDVPLNSEGFYKTILYGENGSTYDFELFCYPSMRELFLRSLEALPLGINDLYCAHGNNLYCESGMWLWAILNYMRLYGTRKSLLARVSHVMEELVTTDEAVAAKRLYQIWQEPHQYNGEDAGGPFKEPKNYSAYHLYKNSRLQEQFSAASILLEAYRALGDRKYLEYAVHTAECLVTDHLEPDGKIRCDRAGGIDYTTVTAMVIPFVDLTLELGRENDPRSAMFRAACEKIADYIVRRGVHFPTEGDFSFADVEMEDGSISCTALSVLLVCKSVCHKQDYLDFAAKILDLHEAWMIYTPDVKMYRSSFRWWENIWEGDQNGPCFCAGHPWAIWRGEADFHYAMLTGSTQHMRNSYNSFMTNICKVQADGKMTASYVADFIPMLTPKGVLVHRYPLNEDLSISRYVWARAADTWLKTCAVIADENGVEAMNAVCREDGIIITITGCPDLVENIFIDAKGYKLCIQIGRALKIISPHEIAVIKGQVVTRAGCMLQITPEDGIICFQV